MIFLTDMLYMLTIALFALMLIKLSEWFLECMKKRYKKQQKDKQ